MKSGAFLKENKTDRKQPSAPVAPAPAARATALPAEQRRRPPVRRTRRSRADRQRRLMMLLIGVLSAILIGCLILLFSLGKSPLEGTWSMDDVTFYRFDSKTKGALVLPSTEYTFTYTARNDVLRIDFDYEGAKDAEYKYVLDGDTLTLDGGTDTTKNLYTLKKCDVDK